MKTMLLKQVLWIGGVMLMFAACASSKPTSSTSVKTKASVEEHAPQPQTQADFESWRLLQPKVGPAPGVSIPVFEQAVLPNGLTVIVANRPSLPLVSVSLVLRSGSAVESKNEHGIADFTYEMMLEGAGQKDGVALAEAFADLGSQMHVQTGEDGAAFSAIFLKKNLIPGIELIRSIATQPTFKNEDFLRKQKERFSDLQSLLGRPQYLSSIATASRIYGDAHPYAHAVMGTPKSVETFSLKKLKRFFRQNVVPKNAALVLAGDISLKEAIPLAAETFGAWRSKGNAPENVPRNLPRNLQQGEPSGFSLAMVAKPGMNQTIISVGAVALSVGHPDEWALRVAINAFSGMFASRLNMNLREDKGYTYGARGQLDAMFQGGAAILSTSVRADVTGVSLVEIVKEIDELNRRPLTELEFNSAIENVLKSVSGWFESVSGLGSAAQSIFQRHTPLTRYADMVAAYEALTIEDVHRAAATYLKRESMQVVLVGDPEIINGQLADLSLGKPVLLENLFPVSGARPRQ